MSISVADGDAKAIAWPVLDLAGPSMYGIARVYDTTPPVVEIRAPKRVLAGEEILFAATVKDLSQVTATWTFGGGGSATGLFASHVFKEPGRDTVTLEVVDAADNRTRLQRAVEVYPNPDTVGVRPDTRITRPPAIRVFRRQVAIHFRSTQQGSRFECRIGRGPIPGSREARLRRAGKGGRGLVVRGKWRHCSSPLRLRKLPRAVYVVRVRAVNEAGLRDSSPAVVRFRIMRPQKRAGAGRPGPRVTRSATG